MTITKQMDSEQLKIVFSSLVNVMKSRGMNPDELINMYQGKRQSKDFVPISIFATDLHPSESLCKYMRENISLSYKEIAALLNRDERSVWTSCRRASLRMPAMFEVDMLDTKLVPISIFSDRRLSILESLVMYLKEQTDETNYRIAKSLNKTPSAIYTIHNRAKAKRG